MIKSNAHDTRISGINCLNLVFVQRACWEVVVVLLPPLLAVVAHHSPTAQQPLGRCPVRANIPDAFMIDPLRSVNLQLWGSTPEVLVQEV